MDNINKLGMESEDIVDDNIKKIQELFPDCVTETADGLKINYEQLKQELSKDIVDDKKERYELTWPGKKEAILEANTPTTKTLRPIRKKSVDFDNTQNIYIEGDNLEALKILQESYLGKVKCIYIDPPYNTGNDFIYKDNFKKDLNEEGQDSGELDEESNKLIANQQSNGRFHSDWLSMMYPRLKLAKNLLTDDGVIFISIDDNESDNLKKVCDEIFGQGSFIAQCVRKRRDSQANLSKNISPIHEYVLIYSKSGGEVLNKVSANIDESSYKNPDNDPRGPYVTMPCTNKGGAKYSVITPTGKIIEEEWRFTKDTYEKLYNDNKIVFPKNGEGKPRYKLFLADKKNEGQLANTWWDFLSSNQEATRELKKFFGDSIIFDMPKPVELIKFCLALCSNKNSIILDFFSGSATTAQAVMQLNAEDDGNRKFFMIQLPEKCDEKSEAYKLGYKTICDIGEERIRRAGKKILKETNADIDYGFRVYKIDSTNMKEIYYEPDKLNQNFLDQYESNVKDDRTPEDLLTQIILDLGLTLDLNVEEKQILNNKVYYVGSNSLVACLDKEIDVNIISTICECKPLKVVFKENGFNNDSDKINTFEKIKELSPDTEISVL